MENYRENHAQTADRHRIHVTRPAMTMHPHALLAHSFFDSLNMRLCGDSNLTLWIADGLIGPTNSGSTDFTKDPNMEQGAKATIAALYEKRDYRAIVNLVNGTDSKIDRETLYQSDIFRIAESYYFLQDYQEALGYYARALKAKVEGLDNRFLVATCYFKVAYIFELLWRKTKKPAYLKKTLQNYVKGLDFDPGYAWAYYNIGCLKSLTGDTESALLYLKNALACDPVGVKRKMAADADLVAVKDCVLFNALLALNVDQEENLARGDQAFMNKFLYAFAGTWYRSELSIICPVCTKRHRFRLATARINVTYGAPIGLNMFEEREFVVKRIFICPVSNKPFIARFRLKESQANLTTAIIPIDAAQEEGHEKGQP